MNGVHVSDLGCADKPVDAEITFVGGCFADTNSLIRQLRMHGICIRFGIHCHSPNIQLLTGANYSNGDFPAIGYQYFFKHALFVKMIALKTPQWCFSVLKRYVGRTLKRVCPNSTGFAFSITACVITPLTSALISFITFIASIMQTTVSGFTSVPTST